MQVVVRKSDGQNLRPAVDTGGRTLVEDDLKRVARRRLGGEKTGYRRDGARAVVDGLSVHVHAYPGHNGERGKIKRRSRVQELSDHKERAVLLYAQRSGVSLATG